MKFKKILFFVIFTFSLLFASYPKASGWVNDYANKLNSRTEKELLSIITEIREKTGFEVGIAIVNSLNGENRNVYATKLYSQWGIGSKKDEGVLFLVAVKEREMMIEVGYGAEGFLTDVRSGIIRDNYIIPNLKKNNYDKAILTGVLAVSEIVESYYKVNLSGNASFNQARRASRKRSNFKSIGSFILFIFLVIITKGRIIKWIFYAMLFSRGGISGGRGFSGSNSNIGGFGGFGGFGGGASGGGGAGGSF